MRGALLLCSSLLVTLLSGCGGGSGNATNPTPSLAAANEIPMTVELWENNSRYPNQGYVSVVVCVPQTSNCQTVDHVLVDTGSYGLRLMSAAVNNLSLPQSTINGSPLAECAHFVSGYTWGPVVTADVKLGTQTAAAIPLQLIDGLYESIPSSCSSGGDTPVNVAAALGANGILGIGAFQQDCPSCATQTRLGHYYTCSSSSCTATAVPLNAQVSNPVALLGANDNGVIIHLPNVSSPGQPAVTGALIFGIATSTNNALGSETILDLDHHGYITTSYGGTLYPQSYVDSGANGIFFTDNTLPRCSDSSAFYCPRAPFSQFATLSSGSRSKTVTFEIGDASFLPAGYAVQPTLVGEGSSFVWGLPFFYGRKVFVSIQGKTAAGRTSPFIAF